MDNPRTHAPAVQNVLRSIPFHSEAGLAGYSSVPHETPPTRTGALATIGAPAAHVLGTQMDAKPQIRGSRPVGQVEGDISRGENAVV